MVLCRAALGQTIPNPSFEADTFTVSPGYVSGQTPAAITGWTADPTDHVGLNPAGGLSPFANNGIIPDGTNVAFIERRDRHRRHPEHHDLGPDRGHHLQSDFFGQRHRRPESQSPGLD